MPDLVYPAAQDSDDVFLDDWAIDKGKYIARLHEFDLTRDATRLAVLIPAIPVT